MPKKGAGRKRPVSANGSTQGGEAKPFDEAKEELPEELAVKEEESESEVEDSEADDSDDVSSSELEDSDDATDDEKEGKEADWEDSSDEEDLRHTVGNVPVRWYEDEDHAGYDLEGRKVTKAAAVSAMEEFLARADDPDYWRKIRDPLTGEMRRLTDAQVAKIRSLQSQKYPSVGFNPYQPYVDFFTHDVMDHPVTNHPPQKREFVPSKLDKEKVSRLVHALKMGWAKPRKPKVKVAPEDEVFYDLWRDDDEETKKSKSQLARVRMAIPAPKTTLPGHAESYRPPPEYLLTEEERRAWEEAEPEERKLDFLPQRFDSLRAVPAYAKFVQERYQRCLDLFLAPRKMKMRLNVDPDSLLPDLPSPADLRPFPNVQALVYEGHSGPVRSVAMEPGTGEYFASAGEDGTLRTWELLSGRCLRTVSLDSPAVSVGWNPNAKLCLLAVAAGDRVLLLNAQAGDRKTISSTEAFLRKVLESASSSESGVGSKEEAWAKAEVDVEGKGSLSGVAIPLKHRVAQVVWHKGGDYLASICPEGGAAHSVHIHQLSSARTQRPLTKLKGELDGISQSSESFAKYQAGSSTCAVLAKPVMISLIPSVIDASMLKEQIRPLSQARRGRMDLDLSAKPYKTLRHQKGAVRAAAWHERFPLFASAADDGTALVAHGRVYADLSKNALVVPLKVLRGHARTEGGLGVLSLAFHPQRPWLLTAGADGTLRLHSD